MQKKVYIILITVLSVFLIGVSCLAVWLYTGYVSPEEYAVINKANRLEAELENAHDRIDEHQASIKKMTEEAAQLRLTIEEKKKSISELDQKISILLSDSKADDAYQQILLDQIQKLEVEKAEQLTQIETLDIRIMELDELIGQYENITTLNFGYQAKKISDLLIKLAEPNRPIRTIVTETIDEQSGEQTELITEQPSQVAFFYRDITTGYTLSYNSDDVMYSASLIKVPYIYSILNSVAYFESQRFYYDAEGNPLFDEEGNPLFEGNHPNLDENGNYIYYEGEEKFDLSRIWTFDKETMDVEGSGIITKEESGFQLTYLQLVEYALKYSDNVAFAELRKVFGYTPYYDTARNLGVRGSSYGFMQLSADDCGKFLAELFTFMEENERYGSVVKEALIGSNFPYLIPQNVSPVQAAHKYGWDHDSYHDMAIVYNDHPYILVILTDLENGGSEANTYISSIVRAINTIHKNFYASK